MKEVENEDNLIVKIFGVTESKVLDLVCKKGYNREELTKELKLNSSDLKIRIRNELNKYRKL